MFDEKNSSWRAGPRKVMSVTSIQSAAKPRPAMKRRKY
jgi:hypothetical protein